MARDYGYIVSPSLQWYAALEKGSTVSGSFDFVNSFVTGEPEIQTFILSVHFLFQENGEKVIYDETPGDKASYDLSPWIQLKSTEITVKQNETVNIPYTINVPQNPPPGGKYAAIVISKKGDSASTLTSSGASLEGRIAYQILAKVAGAQEVNLSSAPVSFTVNKPVFWNWPNETAEFTLNVKNTGNVEYVPSGDIFIHTGDITKSFWNTPINDPKAQLIVLPENSRTFTSNWNPGGPLLTTNTKGITLNLDYFRIGKITATAKVGYFDQGIHKISDQYVTFWVIPLPFILTIITTVLVTFLFTQILKRKKKKT